MSYPRARHLGDGTSEAVLRPATLPPELVFACGGAVHHLATTASTDGDYGLLQWDMAAQPSGPDPHVHRGMSQAFFVLHGSVALFAGDHWTDAGPGDFLYVPPGGIHAFRNTSGSEASMLIVFAPGAPREDYFAELAEIRAAGRNLTNEEWDEVYARHDQVMVNPARLDGYAPPPTVAL